MLNSFEFFLKDQKKEKFQLLEKKGKLKQISIKKL